MVPEKTGFDVIGTALISYRVFGRGPRSVLLMHGNGEDWRTFEKLIPALAEEYTVAAMDSRGHGGSTFGSEPLNLKRIALDAAALMEKLELKNPDIIGFSDGGNAALLLALRYPELIGKLVVAGANLTTEGVIPYVQLPVELGYRVCHALGRFIPQARDKSEILGLMVGQPNINPLRLEKIKADTLVLAGDRIGDDPGMGMFYYVLLPRAKLMIVPGADHCIFGKWSDFTNKTILSFLRGEP